MTPGQYRLAPEHIKPGCSLLERFPELVNPEPPHSGQGHGPDCTPHRVFHQDGRWIVQPATCCCSLSRKKPPQYWYVIEERGTPTPHVPMARPGVIHEQPDLF
ncbi:hypothetical protein D9M68_553730 [compost metagenome]